MSGTLKDAKTNEPIEFVNIGILNKNKGTISNLNGGFHLEIPKTLSKDSLTISHVNYETLKIPIENSKNKTFLLEPRTNELPEVLISNKKKRHRKVGVKSYNTLLWAPIVSKDLDIIEAAQLINIPDKSVKVNYVNMYLRRGFEADSTYIRINFYKNVDDAPGEKIVFQNIVQKTSIETGWNQLDLTAYNIYLDEDFFVSVEFISDFKKPQEINLGAILTKGKGYARRNSLGTWNKVQGAYSINVEIEF
ncbi:carboxypeptidase-like regulatory domain-containing protein [Flavobacteriaceae bacterium XHP0103]|uniref:carboxypeptidase-like regulatory domain-containing protein n=1 Tax=Marixanthotalea marina TaxID=2844359 RepID=UPI002989B439|nr:carboxypeptidase-like regulatory domain-containing protein [Marixanthotalea marina]MBU3822888.1 carboxypeptidase-like regulatory domain-containing protein [Marixanthotalea marina]